jgi:hypothetical protein
MTTVSNSNGGSFWGSVASAAWDIFSSSKGASSGASVGSSNSGGGSYLGTGVQIAQSAMSIAQIIQSNADGKQKAQAIQDQVGLTVADYYTGGLASQFYGWANTQWGGTMNKLRELDAKYNISTILLGKLFGGNRWQTEGSRVNNLLQMGVYIPEGLQECLKLTKGRSIDDLTDHSVASDFVGFKQDGTWVNNLFATTRDESALRPQDIWGAAAFFEKFGNDWLGTMSEAQRTVIAQKALDLGCVSEHHGTIDINWSSELTQFAQATTQKTKSLE